MALQTSGAISLDDIQNEFGGSNPISLNEYYGVDTGVPTSGVISLFDFYGKSAIESYTYYADSYLDSGKFGVSVTFAQIPNLTNAERIRAVGFSSFTEGGGDQSASNLTMRLNGFPDGTGKIPALIQCGYLSDGAFVAAVDNIADWDPWWRYVRIYEGSTLVYTFDRLNVQSCEYAVTDTNTSSGVMDFGQSDTCPTTITPTAANITLTISNG